LKHALCEQFKSIININISNEANCSAKQHLLLLPHYGSKFSNNTSPDFKAAAFQLFLTNTVRNTSPELPELLKLSKYASMSIFLLHLLVSLNETSKLRYRLELR
jgi:hypothetical protein